jgi:hypothetical protein
MPVRPFRSELERRFALTVTQLVSKAHGVGGAESVSMRGAKAETWSQVWI